MAPAAAATVTAPVVDIVIRVYNEQADLDTCVRRLHEYLRTTFPYTYRITIADNASTDATPAIAAGLADALPHVVVARFEEKGRGRALHAVWAASDRRSSPTWTSTCPPTWPRCCPWSRR